ncbi:hypothetical protein K503DRAFT_105306 [Rhizopogon vinicolor AM-OR11-026]|uniref:MYND-type domain-containing protein n=1 Tax=Rhizopogon vinicolor AM-OR11-026 TaxID=1314800 RepID=A0A1B7MF49_9AGAM|nr:hypothetical protein K503DRAFT_105306 [Rhizopogon vinicolor AM-OR11-026]
MQYFAHQLFATWRSPSMDAVFMTMFDAVRNSIQVLKIICRYSSDGRRLLRTVHAAQDYLIQLWLMIGRMPGDRKIEAISPVLKTYHIMGTLRSSLATVAAAVLDDRSLLPSLIRLAGGATILVPMALKYVRRMAKELQSLSSSLSDHNSQPQGDREYEYTISLATGFSHAIEFILLISETSSSCRELLLSMGSMQAVATTISCAWPKFVSDSIHKYPTREISRVELVERRGLMRMAFRYVNFVLHHADNSVSALGEALKSDLLESILRAINIPSHNYGMEQPLREPALETLFILPQFFGSVTIMKRLQCRQELLWTGTDSFVDPVLGSRWHAVASVALPLLKLQLKENTHCKPFFAKKCKAPDCPNVTDDFDASSHPSYRCSACTVAHYCSRRCQVSDWEDHTFWCSCLQAALGCMDSRDMRRSLPLLATLEDFYCSHEKHREGIQKLTSTAREKHPDLDLVLLVDARVFPVEFDVITTQQASQLGVLRGLPPSLLTAFHMADDRMGSEPVIRILRLKYGQKCWDLFSPGFTLRGGFDARFMPLRRAHETR